MRKQLFFSFLLASALLVLGPLDVGAQNARINVHGVITGEKGVPLPGVSIVQRSNNIVKSGAISDADGKYSITATSESDILEFSFIGYIKKSVVVGKNRSIDVTLIEDSKKLDEVVVTGYQTISKERATGAFAKITSEKLELKRLNSLSTLLDGQVAGYTNGLVRGTTTMKGVSSPLYVIDGFPVENTRYTKEGNLVENLPDLNMEDIESITILKDAAATSIYGARAANGVVVIVTKKAAKGKTNVSFSTSLTYSPYKFYTDRLTKSSDIVELEKEWAQSNPHLQGTMNNITPAQYAANLLMNRTYTSQGITSILNYYAGNISESDLNSRLSTLASCGYSYYDDIAKYAKQDPFSQQYNLSISNSSDKNSVMTSVTYKKDRYEDKYSDKNAVGVNIQNSTNITQWMKFDVGAYVNFTKSRTQTYSVLSPGYSYMPYDGLVNSDGTLFTSATATRYSQDVQNNILNKYNMYSMDITPLDELGRNLGKTKNFAARTFAKIDLKLADWLKYNVMFQYEYGSDRYNKLSDKNSYGVRSYINNHASYDATNGFKYNIPYGDINYDQNQYTNAYNFRQQLDFKKTIADRHEVTAIAGSEVRHSKLEYADQTLYGYDPDMLSFALIDGAKLAFTQYLLGGSFSNNDIAYRRESVNRFVSFYGNAAYTFDGKYMATGSLRWDRSNLWGTSSKYQNKPIWSVGAAWNINRENFFKVSWVDMLKLRVSYGIGGNIAKNSAPYMTATYRQNNNVGGLQGTIGSRPNPLLSWEKTITTNIGVDFALLNGRVSGTIEYYDKQGKDLLSSTMGVPTEGFGYSTYTLNNGEMYNRGIEVTLSGDVIRKNDFTWNATLLYGYNINEVTSVKVKAPVYFLQLDYPEAYPIIGNSYNAIYGYNWASLSDKGFPQVYNEKGEKTTSSPTTLEAIKYLGTTVPVYSGSFTSSFRYKDVVVSFLAVYQGGHKMRNTDLPYLNGSVGIVNKDILNRWKKAGDEAYTNIPVFLPSDNPTFNSQSLSVYTYADINVIDASNIRLSNISLSYRLPSSFCSKALLKSARVQFNLENLYTYAFDHKAKYLLGGYTSPNYVCSLYLNF